MPGACLCPSHNKGSDDNIEDVNVSSSVETKSTGEWLSTGSWVFRFGMFGFGGHIVGAL